LSACACRLHIQEALVLAEHELTRARTRSRWPTRRSVDRHPAIEHQPGHNRGITAGLVCIGK
jgi:hypothetical protein